MSLPLPWSLYLHQLSSTTIIFHHGQQPTEREDGAGEQRAGANERKRRRLPECLKTRSGKYLAPKLISLFDQGHRARKIKERAREI